MAHRSGASGRAASILPRLEPVAGVLASLSAVPSHQGAERLRFHEPFRRDQILPFWVAVGSSISVSFLRSDPALE